MAAPRVSLDQRIEALSLHWDLHKPEGRGPFPLVVQLPGCGGKKPFQSTWAKVAVDTGVAALVLDSHAPRGITQLGAYATVCTLLQLRGPERAGDLIASLEWARRQDWVDGARLCAAGWSHGSWTIMDAMTFGGDAEKFTGLTDAPTQPFQGLRSTFLVYPYAGPGALTRTRPWAIKPEVSAVVCGKDMIVGMDGALRSFRKIETQGVTTQVELFHGATHAFDEPDANDFRVRYDAALSQRGHALYADLLRRTLLV